VRRRQNLLIGLAGAAIGLATQATAGESVAWLIVAVVLGATLGLARDHPRATWIFTAIALTAMAPLNDDDFLAMAYLVPGHAFCAARWDTKRGAIAAVVLLCATWELGSALMYDSPVPALLLTGTGWAAGRALREREEVARRLAERLRELEEEREAHAALSVRYERAKIASELHDIVAHAISVMVVQASAGQRLAAHDPELTAETFEVIAGAARQAEDDMGRLVALLGDERPAGAAPDIALIEELVDRAAGSGLNVNLRLEGDRRGLSSAVAQTAYRVVQEGLTNALRYASGAAVAVRVRADGESVVVEVLNEPPPPGADDEALAHSGTGNGLIGLRERLSEMGGTLDAAPTAAGGWRVSARIPRLIPVA
jgi:signal transduction histidine kinase